MKFHVYILYSTSKGKSYVGYTNNLERRIFEHNNSTQKTYTYNFRPWGIIYSEVFDTKKEAMKREKYFKTGVGRELKNQIIKKYLG